MRQFGERVKTLGIPAQQFRNQPSCPVSTRSRRGRCSPAYSKCWYQDGRTAACVTALTGNYRSSGNQFYPAIAGRSSAVSASPDAQYRPDRERRRQRHRRTAGGYRRSDGSNPQQVVTIFHTVVFPGSANAPSPPTAVRWLTPACRTACCFASAGSSLSPR